VSWPGRRRRSRSSASRWRRRPRFHECADCAGSRRSWERGRSSASLPGWPRLAVWRSLRRRIICPGRPNGSSSRSSAPNPSRPNGSNRSHSSLGNPRILRSPPGRNGLRPIHPIRIKYHKNQGFPQLRQSPHRRRDQCLNRARSCGQNRRGKRARRRCKRPRQRSHRPRQRGARRSAALRPASNRTRLASSRRSIGRAMKPRKPRIPRSRAMARTLAPTSRVPTRRDGYVPARRTAVPRPIHPARRNRPMGLRRLRPPSTRHSSFGMSNQSTRYIRICGPGRRQERTKISRTANGDQPNR
jgi:hypothetical protein